MVMILIQKKWINLKMRKLPNLITEFAFSEKELIKQKKESDLIFPLNRCTIRLYNTLKEYSGFCSSNNYLFNDVEYKVESNTSGINYTP